jgi:hypothetical protein
MNPTECGVSECGREASIMKKPWPNSSWAMQKIIPNRPAIGMSVKFDPLFPQYAFPLINSRAAESS